ncbi:MAG TPA: response regulator transcription factor [Candidatus Acidoferrales bacterium]|jgi:DNA-binding NarL/FixJ family response regulator|nr:response regulator transcription factor [Candidatus Acidoferrales bacterium]
MPESTKTVRIVIADDHPIFRHGLKTLLEAESDLRVIAEAGDGAEAVQLAAQSKPDILLLDLTMPRMPGMDALRELSTAELPVHTILLTVAIEKAQIVEALQLGARGIVLKDSATEYVLKSIRAVMSGYYWVGNERVTNLFQYLQDHMPKAGAGKQKSYGLTPRELDVVSAIVAGCTNKEIAQRFSLSEQTVKHHLTSIFDKLGVSTRLELALFATQNNLVK